MATKRINVSCMTGGYLVEWSDPSLANDFDNQNKFNQFQGQIGGTQPRRPTTEGTEVFVDKKKLLDRVKEFLS